MQEKSESVLPIKKDLKQLPDHKIKDMKASDLRIGNIVSVCYENDIVPDTVIVLEPDVVHLSMRKYSDSDRDIIGVPLSEEWLLHFGFIYHLELEVWCFGEIIIKKLKNKWVAKWNTLKKEIEFVHQLQDLSHFIAEHN